MAFPKTKGPYKIKSGDTLSALAKKYKTTVASIMKMNPGIKDKNKIRAGAGIRIGGTYRTPDDKRKAERGRADIKKLMPKSKKKTAMSTAGMGARRGAMIKAMGGKMAKGYAGGGKMAKGMAMGGKMAKGMARGGKMAKGYRRGGAMSLNTLRRAAGGMGYKLTKK